MPPVPTDAFAREFRALPAGERTAFVATLWAARGWETTVEDGLVVALRDAERRRIRVVDPGRFRTPDLDGVDVLVVARDREAVRAAANEAGVEYVPPGELRDLLLYGVDRERARELYENRVGEPLERAPPPSADEEVANEGGRVVDAVAGALPSVPGRSRLVAVLLLVALLGVALTGPPLPSTGTPEQVPVTVSDGPGEEQAGAIGGATPSPTESPYLLPGVTREGVVDPLMLAGAHMEHVQNRSRVRSMTMTGPPNASGMSGAVSRSQTARIVNESYYRLRATSRVAGDEEWTRRFGVYADGKNEYQRIALRNVTRYYRYSIDERPATEIDKPTMILYRYFAGADDVIVGCAIEYETDCPTYRIEVDGEPPAVLEGDVADYQALAIVSDRGVITTIRASYTLPDDDGDGEREQVRFALDYRFEDVTVTPPPWLDDAKNATGTPTPTSTPTPSPTNTST